LARPAPNFRLNLHPLFPHQLGRLEPMDGVCTCPLQVYQSISTRHHGRYTLWLGSSFRLAEISLSAVARKAAQYSGPPRRNPRASRAR
jgi:hypothetical protein